MIAYFDTSAVVPLLLQEPSTAVCRDIWNAADRVVTARISYVEAAAALSSAHRAARIDADQHSATLESLDLVFSQIDVVELDVHLAKLAVELAANQSLRGYDAVQCASGVVSASDEFVAVSGDARLLAAWSELGIATVNTVL